MKAISLVVVTVFVVMYSLWGVYDYHCVRTVDVRRSDAGIYNNRTLSLSNVSILSHKQYPTKDPQTLLLELTIWNGYWKPTTAVPEEGITVWCKTGADSELLRWLDKGGTHFLRLQVQLHPEVNYLTSYQIGPSESWLSAPYQISLALLNRWVALSTAAIFAMILQAAVAVFIALLIIEGALSVLPDVG